MIIRRVLPLLGLLAAVGLVMKELPDIRRYIKIEKM